MLGPQFLPFYHGSDHRFNEGDTVIKGMVTRSKVIASLYGHHVYEVEPHPNREDPDWGGHTILKKVDYDPQKDEEEDTESIQGWEVDKDDPLWDPFRSR